MNDKTESNKIVQIRRQHDGRPIWTSQVIVTRNMEVIYHDALQGGPDARTASMVIRWMEREMFDWPERNACCMVCKLHFGRSDVYSRCVANAGRGLPAAVYAVEYSVGTRAHLHGVCEKCFAQVVGDPLEYLEPYYRDLERMNLGSRGHAEQQHTDTTPSPPIDMADLRSNAVQIVAWTEALAQIPDQDSAEAVALCELIDALLAREANILGDHILGIPPNPRYAKGNTRFAQGDTYPVTRTWRVVEATLPPEKIAEVDRYIDELWQQSCRQVGNPTTTKGEGASGHEEKPA
jgi:hypothetical protein